MSSKTVTTSFDLRVTDYVTGRKMLVGDPINCECCGRKITRGFNVSTGERIGTECGWVGERLRYETEISAAVASMLSISQKQAAFFGVAVN